MNRVLWAVLAVVVSLTGCRRENKYASLCDNPVPAEIKVVLEGAGVVTNVYVGEILAKAAAYEKDSPYNIDFVLCRHRYSGNYRISLMNYQAENAYTDARISFRGAQRKFNDLNK